MERGNRLTKSMSAAASRHASPSPSLSHSPSSGTANRRVAKLNLYLMRSARTSNEQLHRGLDGSSGTPNKPTIIKRWDGNRRMTVKWDSLRRVGIP